MVAFLFFLKKTYSQRSWMLLNESIFSFVQMLINFSEICVCVYVCECIHFSFIYNM